jgi:hypothetical protein
MVALELSSVEELVIWSVAEVVWKLSLVEECLVSPKKLVVMLQEQWSEKPSGI